MSRSNIVRSSVVANPKSAMASFATLKRVKSRTSSPKAGRLAAVVPEMPSSNPTPETSTMACDIVASTKTPCTMAIMPIARLSHKDRFDIEYRPRR